MATSRSVELVLEVLPVEAPLVLVRAHACMTALMYRPLKVALWATINGGKKVAMRRQPSSCSPHSFHLINRKNRLKNSFTKTAESASENPQKASPKTEPVWTFLLQKNGASLSMVCLPLPHAPEWCGCTFLSL